MHGVDVDTFRRGRPGLGSSCAFVWPYATGIHVTSAPSRGVSHYSATSQWRHHRNCVARPPLACCPCRHDRGHPRGEQSFWPRRRPDSHCVVALCRTSARDRSCGRLGVDVYFEVPSECESGFVLEASFELVGQVLVRHCEVVQYRQCSLGPVGQVRWCRTA